MRHAVLLRLFAGNVSSRGVPEGVGFAGTASARALGTRPSSQAPPVLLAGQVACWGDDVEFSSLGWPSWVAKRSKHSAVTKPRRWYPVVARAPKGAASGRSRPYSTRPRSNPKGEVCKYHAAGYCFIHAESRRCRQSHDDAYAAAVEAQWLQPACAERRRTLEELCKGRSLPSPSLARLIAPYPDGAKGAWSVRKRNGLHRRFDPPTVAGFPKQRNQPFSHFVVLDLEGADEIIELPAVLVNSRTLQEEGRFHRWVRPVTLFEGKALNPQSTAVPFTDALTDFDRWVEQCGAAFTAAAPADGEVAAREFTFAVVTCGNWDLKTQVPKQCAISGCAVPPWSDAWINLKDVFSRFYARANVSGMQPMLKKLGMPVAGQHHLGMHDTENIARVLVHLVQDGAKADITGRRQSDAAVNDDAASHDASE